MPRFYDATFLLRRNCILSPEVAVLAHRLVACRGARPHMTLESADITEDSKTTLANAVTQVPGRETFPGDNYRWNVIRAGSLPTSFL